MKFLFIFGVILLSVSALDDDYVSKVLTELQEVADKCTQSVGATADDLAELIKQNFPPPTHAGKCLLACFDEHYKMLKSDGTFDKEATINVFSEIKNQDEDLYRKIIKIIDICMEKPEIFEDRCETASAMSVCVKMQAEKLGVSKESFVG